MVTVTSAWHEHENAILDALAGLRSLASSTTTPEGAHAGGLVDVVHGSEGAWNAWWTRVDLQGGADVAAIVPDLAPLHAIADGDVDAHGRDLLATLATGRIRVRLLLPDAARGDARVDQAENVGVRCLGRGALADRFEHLSRSSVLSASGEQASKGALRSGCAER